MRARSHARSFPQVAVPNLHQGAQNLFTTAKPSEMTFAGQVQQLRVGKPGYDVFPVGERDDVVVVSVPPADGDFHLVQPESPVAGKGDDIGERRSELLATTVEQIVEEHRLELGPSQQMPVGPR
ncbi:hypothetical protein RN09_1470 [Mycobacterium tuberculosis variant africanum]|nr:hypothetical protein RN09_1470 [Mycobacterium tuberculosis variant africanum]